jgi:dTDP-4-amino-4,6-dideoxygalactose transaminase
VLTSKPYLPDRRRLDRYLDRIYDKVWLTNNGPLVGELQERLIEHLGVPRLLPTANGTLALQIAYRVLGLRGDVVTTPFSFVATAASLVWEGIRPVFGDIDADSLDLDPASVEAAITSETTGIVPVHVFGNPCSRDIDRIAADRDLKLVYDAAHAFGVRQDGESVLCRGDAAILSFHATKVFHTVEGGAIVFADEGAHDLAKQMINFGIDGEDSVGGLGINAKMNEFEAAMGLAVLDEMHIVTSRRRRAHERYVDRLTGAVRFPVWSTDTTQNHAYFPVLFDTEAETLAVRDSLLAKGVQPRRYFRPSLDTLPYVTGPAMLRARRISDTVLCLPLYPDLTEAEVDLVAGVVLTELARHRNREAGTQE